MAKEMLSDATWRNISKLMQANTKAICPRCDGRKAKLFLRNARFACRTFQRLRYHSQALDPMARNQWTYSRVQKKLAQGRRQTQRNALAHV